MKAKKKGFKKGDFERWQKQHMRAIYDTLQMMFVDGLYMDKAIEKTMRNNKHWGVKDRSFVAETVHELIRNWRLMQSIASAEHTLSEKNYPNILASYILWRGDKLPEVGFFSQVNMEKIANKMERLQKIRKIRLSYPDWLDELCSKELGSKWDKIAEALNVSPPLCLRTNTLKTDRRALEEMLEEEGVKTEPVSWAPEALELVFSRNVFRTQAFTNGLFEVQDAGSQAVSRFANPKPGQRVIDACAGSGGKTLHLAALMQNRGKIISLDIKEFKLKELRKRASRAGASVVETKLIESAKTTKRLNGTADIVLLDLPCSGLGVLRRNPDTKWRLTPEEVDELRVIQKDLLERYSHMAKVGGEVIYVTCSILPSEAEDQVKHFLTTHKNFELDEERRIWPQELNCDGFYLARLKRKE